jgi:hypothetical protein
MIRDVFAKGLRKYSFDTIEQELAAAWDSPYRYWWATMCCSRDYWWVCRTRGDTLDERLWRVYEAFGDRCWDGFDQWWRYAARDKFVEQVSPEKITQVGSQDFIDEDDFLPDSNWMYLRVPLNIGEAKLVSEFKTLLRGHPNRRYTRAQTSNFPIKRHKGMNLEIFRKAIEVWHEINRSQVRRKRTVIQKDDEDSLYMVGERLRLNEAFIIRQCDSEAKEARKRNAMKVAVSRMHSRAVRLIQNVEIGIFPSYAEVRSVRRWTQAQQEELDDAVERGEWNPLYMDHQAWATRFAEIYREEQASRAMVLKDTLPKQERPVRPETGRFD